MQNVDDMGWEIFTMEMKKGDAFQSIC